MGRKFLNKVKHYASTRIFAAILAVNLPLMAISYFAVTQLIIEYMTSSFENTTRSHARLIALSINQQPNTGAIQKIFEDLTLSGEVVYAAYVRADNDEKIESFNPIASNYQFKETFGYGELGDNIYAISVTLDDHIDKGSRLRLGYDEVPTAELVNNIYRWGLYACAIFIALLVPITLLVTRRLTSPLKELGTAARKVSEGDIEHPLNIHLNIVELDKLAEDVEHMRSNLNKRNKEIAEREALHRAVLENIAEGIITLDSLGYIESINDAALNIFGYSGNEVLGTPFTRFLSSEDASKCVNPSGRPKTGKGQNFVGIKKNGTQIPILLSISDFKHGGHSIYTVVVQDIRERVILEEKLMQLAYYDPLTGLPNRRLFHDRLNHALLKAKNNKHRVGIMFLDLDRFKSINDNLGHLYGDMLIKSVANRLLSLIHKDDTVARLGGDEFTIILNEINDEHDAKRVADQIMEQFTQPFILGEHETFASTSIGITLFPNDATSVENLIKNADAAMYQAKASGRNAYEFYSAQAHAVASRQHELETELRKALQNSELEVYYQPQVKVSYQQQIDQFTGEFVGAEALLRWHHPEHGTIYPEQFISIAEESGLITSLGEWVLRTSFLQQLEWTAAGLPAMRISINLSSRQLRDPDFSDRVFKIINETGLDPSYLILELTENMILHNYEEVADVLLRFREKGIMISIDDFGTGHAPLTNIQTLPVDEIKIDKSFIHNITHDTQNAAIAEAVLDMAHKLNLRIVAEGVELEEQLIYLHNHNCKLMQGNYFSRAVSAEAFEKLLRSEIESQNPLYQLWREK